MSSNFLLYSLKRLRTFWFVCFFTGFTLFTGIVKSQDVKSLSLKETVDLTLKNSNILKASKARSEEADAQVRQALDNRLPNGSISGSYLRMANPTIGLKTDAFKSGPDTSSQKTAFPKVNQAMYGILNLSLPVYAGGRIRYGIESAKYLQQATVLDAENDKEQVILNAINAYVNLYKAAVTVNVVEANLEQSRQQDTVFTRLEQNGLLARNDLLKSELHTSNVELALLDAQSNLKTATVNMDLMIGYPESTELKIDSSSFNENVSLKTIDEYEQSALQKRNDIQALTFRKKAATTGIAIAKAEQYPSIALTGGYIAANIPHLITITNAANIGVGLQYNLSSLWKSKAKIQQAKSREAEIVANQAALFDEVKVEVNRDYENFLLSQKKTEVYKKAVMQATENYRITKNKYDVSLVNTTDLLEANVSLLQAQINLAVSKADVLLAYSKLLQTTGSISENQ